MAKLVMTVDSDEEIQQQIRKPKNKQ